MKNPQETADKIAIVETLYGYLAGLDQRNDDYITAALAVDAISDFRPAGKKAGFEYPVLEGREVILTALRGSLNHIDTSHSVSNPRVTLNGDKAVLHALVEAQHLPSEDHSRHYMMKNSYDVELVKEGEDWLIQRVTVDNIWRLGDPSVLSGI